MRRFATAALGAAMMSGLLVMPVAAAPPVNDAFADAIAVTLGMPQGPIDTTEATGGAEDPDFADECGIAPPTNASVWFTWTPAAGEDGDKLAHTFGSDYDTTLLVLTGTPGAFSLVGCNDDAGTLESAVLFTAIEGATYVFMVDTFADSPGGNLTFTVEVAPPPVELTLTINATGGKANDGTAVVGGTVRCSAETTFVEIQVSLRQRAGRAVIDGFGFAFAETCGPTPTPWTSEVVGNGIFAGGPAQAFAVALTCRITCSEGVAEATVRLKGGR
jgi:hypothetical protein